ncbi:hypothetical protein [Flavobacterium hercynium]|uniref:DUF2946 domain-containing protein n=1 Tax=Flavobacterium hercynium TaxID=387094 RepID=A0A226HAH9_9FLAO|nr:hypothetical protein [Flavobacterium hercynium]OXA90430.1 hypothetical protein B0A66_12740 [Flavobacterium hercynium]SMP26246.1 hypothetical protein SAMN06265346_10976 [Flavobacterium hercynium]
MKKKFIIINLLLSLTVLLSMLFQTIHSYEHIFQQITEKTCEHKYTGNQKEITHSHSVDNNNCPICHFTFSTFISNSFYAVTFHKATVVTATTFFYAKTSSTFFKGSLFALRAPPLL